jgi:hypothetical protein
VHTCVWCACACATSAVVSLQRCHIKAALSQRVKKNDNEKNERCCGTLKRMRKKTTGRKTLDRRENRHSRVSTLAKVRGVRGGFFSDAPASKEIVKRRWGEGESRVAVRAQHRQVDVANRLAEVVEGKAYTAVG